MFQFTKRWPCLEGRTISRSSSISYLLLEGRPFGFHPFSFSSLLCLGHTRKQFLCWYAGWLFAAFACILSFHLLIEPSVKGLLEKPWTYVVSHESNARYNRYCLSMLWRMWILQVKCSRKISASQRRRNWTYWERKCWLPQKGFPCLLALWGNCK